MKISDAQIRALAEMYDFNKNRKPAIGYHQHEGDGYRRVALSNFSMPTAKALLKHKLLEPYCTCNEYIVRITPAGIAWLERQS